MRAPARDATVQVFNFRHVDDRIPPPGTIIVRKYKKDVYQVLVRNDGFEFAGQVYSSLSAVSKAITGAHCNGFHFFNLGPGGDQ